MADQQSRSNPYVGPRAFQIGEQDKLFGRDREIREVLNLLIAQRIFLLNSPSGAGKTSLIQAGLIPRLKKEDFHVFPVARVNLEPPAGANGGENKFNRYVFSVLASLEADLPEEQKTPQDDLIGMSLADYLDQCPKDPGAPDTEALIFDQFEEILTVAPFDREGKAAFFTQLGTALRNRRRWALFAMREDYVAALDPYARFIPTHLANTFRLDLLGAEAAWQAIAKPARNEGVTFTEEAAQKLVDDLRMVRVQSPDLSIEAQKEPEEQKGPYVEPVQLQVVCYRLWEQLPEDAKEITKKDVTDIGDVDTALAEYYAERVKTISEEAGVKERAIRDWFDYRLITERGLRNQVLLEVDKIGLEIEAIRQLVNAHLVRQERRGGAIYFELAHDRLVRPVLDNNIAWKAQHLSVLQRQASRWEREGYKDYLLLRGETLAEAEAWAAANPDELTQVDEKFLQASGELRAKEEQARAMAEQAIRLESAEKLAEAERQRRESAEKLAETERQRGEDQAAAAAQLRRRAVYLAAALVAAVLLLIAAASLAWYAQGQRSAAEAGQATAQAAQSTAEAAATLEAAARQEEARQRKSAELQREDAREQRRIAEERRQRAEQERTIATARQLAAQASNLKNSQPDLALLLSLEGNALAEQIAAETNEVVLDPRSSLLDVLTGSQLIASFHGNQNYLSGLAFSQDGSLLVSGDYRGNLVLWDIASGRSITQTTLSDPALSLATSLDGSLVAVGDYHGRVHLWNVHSGEIELILEQTVDLPRGVAFSPDGHLLAAAGNGLYLEQTGDGAFTSLSNSDYQSQLAFTQDGSMLATVNVDGVVEVWDTGNSGRVARLMRQDPEAPPIVYLAFAPLDQAFQPPLLLAAEAGGRLVVWDLARPHEGPVSYQVPGSQFAYNPAGSTLVSDTPDGNLQICALSFRPNLACTTSRLLADQPGRSTVLAISPGTGLLASGREDGSIIVWQINGNAITGPALQTHQSAVAGLAFQDAEEGLNLVSGAGGEDDSLILWDVRTHQPEATLAGVTQKSTNFVSASLAYSPDGKILASGDKDGEIRLWDTGDLSLLHELPAYLVPVKSVAFSPDGRTLAAGSQDGSITLWDPATGQLVNQLSGHSGTVNSLAFSPDGKVLASGGGDGKLVRWDAATGQVISSFSGDLGIIHSLAFSPDGRALVAGGQSVAARAQTGAGTTLLYWDLTGGATAPRALQSPVNVVSSVAFSPNGKFLASGSPDGEVFVWDFSDRAQISRRPLAWEIGSVTGLAFSKDSRFLIVGAAGGLSLWDAVTLERKGMLPGGGRLTAGPVIDPSGGQFAAAGDEQEGILFWNLVTTNIVQGIRSGLDEEVKQKVTSLAIDPNGEILASGGAEGSILLWNLVSREISGQPLSAHSKKVTHLAFSPSGNLFASGGMDGSVKIWDSGGQELNRYSQPDTRVSALAFSPSAPLLAISFTDPSDLSRLYLWDLAHPNSRPEEVDGALTEDGFGPILSMAFDSRGGRLAMGRGNGMISLWDASERRWMSPVSARVSARQEIAVKSLAFSADGAWLASGLADGSLILWSGQDLQQIGRLTGHASSVDALAFSPGSKILASAGADTRILLWEVDTQRWVSLACAAVNRNLSWAEWVKYVNPDQKQPYHETCPGDFVPSDIARHYLELAKNSSSNPDQVRSNLDLALQWSGEPTNGEQWREICQFAHEQNLMAEVKAACIQVGSLISDPSERAYFYSGIGEEDLARQAAEQVEDPLDRAYLYAELGEQALARQAAEQVEDPLDRAYLYMNIGDEALARQAAQQVEDPLDRADFYMNIGDKALAKQAYWEAVQAATTVWVPYYLNNLCWNGSLQGFADVVLPACERGVKIATGNFLPLVRDSRGLARGLTGDYAGAIEDFQFLVDWLRGEGSNATREEWRDEIIARREKLIAALAEGQNPFDEETLQQMAEENF
jgi:WD40 repeat protein